MVTQWVTVLGGPIWQVPESICQLLTVASPSLVNVAVAVFFLRGYSLLTQEWLEFFSEIQNMLLPSVYGCLQIHSSKRVVAILADPPMSQPTSMGSHMSSPSFCSSRMKQGSKKSCLSRWTFY